ASSYINLCTPICGLAHHDSHRTTAEPRLWLMVGALKPFAQLKVVELAGSILVGIAGVSLSKLSELENQGFVATEPLV
nr:hypothetical protein [Acidimicrobiales bacterium]